MLECESPCLQKNTCALGVFTVDPAGPQGDAPLNAGVKN